MGGVTMTCCITEEKLINDNDKDNDKKSENIYSPLVYSYPVIRDTPVTVSRNISTATTIPN